MGWLEILEKLKKLDKEKTLDYHKSLSKIKDIVSQLDKKYNIEINEKECYQILLILEYAEIIEKITNEYKNLFGNFFSLK